MNFIKTYESFNNLTFDEIIEDDKVTIIGYINESKVGEIIIEFVVNGFKLFEDIISEDEYDNLFPDDKFAKIEHLEIENNFKRMGYAKQLMSKGLDYIKDQGESVVYLNASPIGLSGLNIHNLVKFYESFGFKTFIEEKNNEEMILNII